jgi:hypothetical protein
MTITSFVELQSVQQVAVSLLFMHIALTLLIPKYFINAKSQVDTSVAYYSVIHFTFPVSEDA